MKIYIVTNGYDFNSIFFSEKLAKEHAEEIDYGVEEWNTQDEPCDDSSPEDINYHHIFS